MLLQNYSILLLASIFIKNVIMFSLIQLHNKNISAKFKPRAHFQHDNAAIKTADYEWSYIIFFSLFYVPFAHRMNPLTPSVIFINQFYFSVVGKQVTFHYFSFALPSKCRCITMKQN